MSAAISHYFIPVFYIFTNPIKKVEYSTNYLKLLEQTKIVLYTHYSLQELSTLHNCKKNTHLNNISTSTFIASKEDFINSTNNLEIIIIPIPVDLPAFLRKYFTVHQPNIAIVDGYLYIYTNNIAKYRTILGDYKKTIIH